MELNATYANVTSNVTGAFAPAGAKGDILSVLRENTALGAIIVVSLTLVVLVVRQALAMDKEAKKQHVLKERLELSKSVIEKALKHKSDHQSAAAAYQNPLRLPGTHAARDVDVESLVPLSVKDKPKLHWTVAALVEQTVTENLSSESISDGELSEMTASLPPSLRDLHVAGMASARLAKSSSRLNMLRASSSRALMVAKQAADEANGGDSAGGGRVKKRRGERGSARAVHAGGTGLSLRRLNAGGGSAGGGTGLAADRGGGVGGGNAVVVPNPLAIPKRSSLRSAPSFRVQVASPQSGDQPTSRDSGTSRSVRWHDPDAGTRAQEDDTEAGDDRVGGGHPSRDAELVSPTDRSETGGEGGDNEGAGSGGGSHDDGASDSGHSGGLHGKRRARDDAVDDDDGGGGGDTDAAGSDAGDADALPSGWDWEYDDSGGVVYVAPDGTRTTDDPREGAR